QACALPIGGDDHVPHVELPLRVAGEPLHGPFAVRPPDGLAEREHVGGPVLLSVPAGQLTHLGIADEGDGDPCVGRQPVRLHGTADRATDRPEGARRIAAERESQVPDALDGGGVAVGNRAMRSSGYGIRSWYTPARSSRNAS